MSVLIHVEVATASDDVVVVLHHYSSSRSLWWWLFKFRVRKDGNHHQSTCRILHNLPKSLDRVSFFVTLQATYLLRAIVSTKASLVM